MKTLFHLVLHSIRRIRTLVLAAGLLLAAFQVLLVAVANSIQASDAFEQLGATFPSFLREIIGPSFSAFMSFKGIVSVGYFHLVVIGALVGLSIAIATIPTSEIETRFIDLILSRSVPRHAVITRSIIVCILAIATLLILMLAGTTIRLS